MNSSNETGVESIILNATTRLSVITDNTPNLTQK